MLSIGLIGGAEKTISHLSAIKDLSSFLCLKGVFLGDSFSNLEIRTSLYNDPYNLIDDSDCLMS